MSTALLQRIIKGGASLAIVAMFIIAATGDKGWLLPTFYLVSFAILVTIGYLGWRAKDARRRARTTCLECGYSRRGLPDGASCPECGRSLPPTAWPITKKNE